MKFNSDGEEKVYKALVRECPDYIVLHSVFLNRHVKGISGEIDLLVLIPEHGFFCLEVKHGGVERLSDGRWKFTDRNGKDDIKWKGPFQQVKEAMHSLRNYFPQIFNNNQQQIDRFNKFMFGSGVMFTSLDEFQNLSTEGEKWELFLRKNFKNIRAYFENLSNEWHKKYAATANAYYWYNNNESRPSKKDCELFRKALRGDFRYDYTLINRIVDDEYKIKEFTEQQFDLIDSTYDNPRSLILGGAGTGKTIMALEIARRKTSEGLRIGLFCFNRLLGLDIKDKINNLSPDFIINNSFAGTLDSYMLSFLKKEVPLDGGQEFWVSELPTDFYIYHTEKPEQEKFDYLIIDEVQDLLKEERLEIIDTLLKGGLKEGYWTFLGDLSNQAIYLDGSPEVALDRLTNRANYSKLKLKYNCRNPKTINNLNESVTGCEKLILREGMPEGQSKIHFYRDIQTLITELENIINELKNKNIPDSKITLLSPNSLQLEDYSDVIKKALKNGVVKQTIKSYKGLENTYIVLMGFNEVNTENILRDLYVGISRSKFGLFLLLSTSLKKDFENLISKNLTIINQQ
jgi:hypothetical protein